MQACQEVVPLDKLAAHMHDTYGQALANILACLQMGITVIDTSIARPGWLSLRQGCHRYASAPLFPLSPPPPPPGAAPPGGPEGVIIAIFMRGCPANAWLHVEPVEKTSRTAHRVASSLTGLQHLAVLDLTSC